MPKRTQHFSGVLHILSLGPAAFSSKYDPSPLPDPRTTYGQACSSWNLAVVPRGTLFFFLLSFNSVDKVVPTVVSSTATACRRVGLTCVSIVLGLSEDALWMKVHLLAGHGWADAGDAAWRQRL